MDLLKNIPLTYLLLFFGTFTLSVVINNILLNFSRNLGIRKNQGIQIRWNPTAKPALGGISFYVVFLISFICMEFILGSTKSYLSDAKLFGIFSTISLAFFMGLADDAYDTKPLIKSVTQLICAIVLILTGTRVYIFESEFLNYMITVVWVVGLMNSINMLDNMDGITTLVSIVILTFIVALNIAFHNAIYPLSVLTICTLGALIGFLVYNWHPSKMFMGDTGSQFLGIFLAILGIEYCWNYQIDASQSFPMHHYSKAIVIIALTFVIPLSDTTTVVLNRLAKGQSPFIGGKDHTTHHLFFKGVTEKRIAVLFVILNGLGVLLAYMVISDNNWNNMKALVYSVYPVCVFGALFFITKYKKKKV